MIWTIYCTAKDSEDDQKLCVYHNFVCSGGKGTHCTVGRSLHALCWIIFFFQSFSMANPGLELCWSCPVFLIFWEVLANPVFPSSQWTHIPTNFPGHSAFSPSTVRCGTVPLYMYVQYGRCSTILEHCGQHGPSTVPYFLYSKPVNLLFYQCLIMILRLYT